MTLKRNNAEMERNSATATNNFGYYKDPINYISPNTNYSDIYQLTYPFEDEFKDKRYQLPSATVSGLQQQTQALSTPQQPQLQQQQQQAQQLQSIPNIQYHQNYSKADYYQQTYKATEKTSQSVINPYAGYTYPNYKDNGQYGSAAGYYDQYKFNVGLGTTTANYGKTGKDTNYHQNYSPGLYPDGKLGASAYCDEVALAAKSSMAKSVNSSQMSQLSMYTNCYGYPTATTFPNQNYCSYSQSCNDDARIIWDEFQTNRRMMPTYIAPPTAATSAPVQGSTVSPQSSVRLKGNYSVSADYYGSSAAHYAYHPSDAMRSREKIMYPMNSHVASENLYNTRSRCLPRDYKYQTMPQSVMVNSYDHRYNYVSNDAQAFNYCPQRQDSAAAAYHHPAYTKSSLVNPPPAQKHIRPPTAMPNEYCSSQPYYVCNDQISSVDLQDPYSQQCLRDSRHPMAYSVGMTPGVRNISVPNEIINKEALYSQALEGGYYTHANSHNSQGPLAQSNPCPDKSKTSIVKGQNLREFLATWNEDEDEGVEKMDDSENQMFLQQTNIEVENNTVENHLQFKGSFNTRPKIHVGITVDSNVANNQYINLPDIIIDIEKPKDTDLISHSIGATSNGNTEKLLLLESVDVPVSDLSQYGNMNLLGPTAEEISFPDPGSGSRQEAIVLDDTGVQETAVNLTTENLNEISENVLKSIENVENVVANAESIVANVESIAKAVSAVESPAKEDSRTAAKTRKRKRVIKTKTKERTSTKCKMLGKLIKTKSGKLIRIRKVMKKSKKRINLTPKLISNAATANHSKDEPNRPHSPCNPKSLFDICVSVFNSKPGRDWIINEFRSKSDTGDTESISDELNQQPNNLSSSVPKLSALCECALNSFYEEKNILLLNLEELDSNLYFIECDINENVVSTDQNSLRENDFTELFIDDETDADETTNNSNDCENDNISERMDVDHSNRDICNVLKSSSANGNDDYSNRDFDNSVAEICLTSDENSRDFSALHHEEIVPDNLHAFKNEKLLKYLQNKYIQKSNYLKIFIIDKICKKYRKYVLKRRKNQKQQNLRNDMWRSLVLLKLKERFPNRSRDLKIGTRC